MLNYMLSNGLISRHQHGFLSRRSTGTQLLDCLNDWTINIDHRESLDVIYIDFAKAFDSVVHRKLIYKLSCYGIAGNLLAWIEDFLCNRFQFVVIDGFRSSTEPVLSGVPQGSVLGPILFIVFINDACDEINSAVSCKLYADDIKLYSIVDFNGESNDLKIALDNLCCWAEIWQLKINIDKCNVLRIGNNNIFGNYEMNDIVVPRVDTVTDLGIVVCGNLCFSDHITSCISKAYRRSFLIFKGFSCRNADLLLKAYTTYIRPLLEYNTYIWSPADVDSINKLENVQRRFTKRIPSLSNQCYKDRLSALGITTLEYRRLRFDLIMMYRIVHNLVDLDRDDFVMISNNVTRNALLKLFKPRSLTSLRANFLCVRCINAWNALPEATRAAANINVFKRNLSMCNLSTFLKVFQF